VRTRAEFSRKEQGLIPDVVGETGKELDGIVELDRVISVVGSLGAINIYRTTWKMVHIDWNQQAMPVQAISRSPSNVKVIVSPLLWEARYVLRK